MQRKDFFKQGLFKALKKAVDTTEEVYEAIQESVAGKTPTEDISGLADNKEYLPETPGISKSKKINRNLKFPPGAIPDKAKFLKKCTGCGDCIQACPYNTIFPLFVLVDFDFDF